MNDDLATHPLTQQYYWRDGGAEQVRDKHHLSPTTAFSGRLKIVLQKKGGASKFKKPELHAHRMKSILLMLLLTFNQ
jgi:hypothetical protein